MAASIPARFGRRLAPSVALLGVATVGLLVVNLPRLERADFVFVNGAEVTSLDPQAALGVPEQRIARALFECLVERAPDGLEILPAAAQSHTQSADKLEYRFQLREQARWSNGEPVLASDFEASFRRMLDPATQSPFAAQLDVVVGAKAYRTGPALAGEASDQAWSKVEIRASGPLELTIRLEYPRVDFLHLLACPQMAPVHVASLKRLQQDEPSHWRRLWNRPEHLVTNGAFVLVERRLNERLRLARSSTYWDSANVGMASIDALSLDSFGTALNLYLTGEADWLDGNVPPLLVPTLLERKDYQRRPYLGTYFLRVNTTRPPWNDVRLRRALSLTIDRRSICNNLLRAGQRPTWSLVPWNMLGEPLRETDYGQDVVEAFGLLRDAGYRGEGAKRLPALEIHFNSSEVHRDIAEAVAADWKKTMQLECVLVNQEWKVYLDSQKRLDYDISRSSWIADMPDALNFLEIMVTGSENNRTGWSDPEYDAKIEAARRELDLQARKRLLTEALDILNAQAPVLPLYAYVTQDLMRPELQGFSTNLINDQNPKRWRWKSGARPKIQRGLVGSSTAEKATQPPKAP